MDWVQRAEQYIKGRDFIFDESPAGMLHNAIKEVRDLRKERDELKTKVDKMHGVQAGLESWNLELKREVERLEKERDELREKVLLADEAFTSHDELVTELRSQVERLEKELENLTTTLSHYRAMHGPTLIHVDENRPAPKSLCDEFAMAALTGMVARPEVNDPELGIGMDDLVDDAFRYADLCMEARKK